MGIVGSAERDTVFYETESSFCEFHSLSLLEPKTRAHARLNERTTRVYKYEIEYRVQSSD